MPDCLDSTAGRLAALPAVRAVALGGSRAQGMERPDSDWDLAIYYRGPFDPADLRALGWEGEVSDLGAWGGGVFNGGAWLTIGGHRVDVHYRDLDVVEHELAEARQGRFRVEPLLFHLAGIRATRWSRNWRSTGCCAGSCRGRRRNPEKLRHTASERWYGTARATLAYAEANHAGAGRRTELAGAIATAAAQTGHAVLAARGEWVTNEKRLLDRAGLRGVDDVIGALGAGRDPLSGVTAEAGRLFERAMEAAPPLRS